MSVIYYHSDWHFNHDFVAKTRGFDNAQQHDEWLIRNINSVVTKRDHLWVLGDVFMGSVTEGLKQIARVNGIKHLVLGNHDAAHPMHRGSHAKQRRFLEVFESVHLHEQHRIGNEKVNLSHFPYQGGGDHYDEDRYDEWRLPDRGLWLLNGHVHHAWPASGRQINVGVDYRHFPVPQEKIANHIALAHVDRSVRVA